MKFSSMKVAQNTGAWNASNQNCNFPLALGIVAPSSLTGWDTFRVAVKLILRSSAQEVRVIVDQPPSE